MRFFGTAHNKMVSHIDIGEYTMFSIAQFGQGERVSVARIQVERSRVRISCPREVVTSTVLGERKQALTTALVRTFLLTVRSAQDIFSRPARRDESRLATLFQDVTRVHADYEFNPART